MPVYSRHTTYADALEKWKRCRDAYAGTDAVKKRGQDYLPMLEGHDINAPIRGPYNTYKARALFYPAMTRTVKGLTGLIFGKPPTRTKIPKSFEEQFTDVTQSGVSLEDYAQQLCQEVLITGRVGVLLDMPAERVPGAYPYWATYSAESIINWRTARVNGRMVLTLLVLEELVEVDNPDDSFAPLYETQYRVLELVSGYYTVTIWIQNEKKDKWIIGTQRVPLRKGIPLTYIPFIILGPSGIDPAIENPPCLDLVDVNLSHYRTSADQEHAAHFTALPTPYITGHKLPEGTSELAIGSGTAWILQDAAAKVGMLEFTGAGMKALADLKEEKRQLMATLGARMLETQKKVAEAQQTVAMRHAGEQSALSMLASALEQAVTQLIQWHLSWAGADGTSVTDATVDFNVDIMDSLTGADLTALVTTWQAGGISHKTLYHNLEWGEWTRPDVDFEQEQKDIAEEAANKPKPVVVVPSTGGPVPVPGAP